MNSAAIPLANGTIAAKSNTTPPTKSATINVQNLISSIGPCPALRRQRAPRAPRNLPRSSRRRRALTAARLRNWPRLSSHGADGASTPANGVPAPVVWTAARIALRGRWTLAPTRTRIGRTVSHGGRQKSVACHALGKALRLPLAVRLAPGREEDAPLRRKIGF